MITNIVKRIIGVLIGGFCAFFGIGAMLYNPVPSPIFPILGGIGLAIIGCALFAKDFTL